MTDSPTTETGGTYLRRERAPCKRCSEVIDTDVPACPRCGNQPLAAIKRASIAAILVGTILTIPAAHAVWAFWFESLLGLALFVIGVSGYWIVTGRYSPTKYDAGARPIYSGSEST